MLVDPSNSAAGSAVTGAIRQAAQATGTSFHYLLATAQVESGLNPQAGASTSSARGLFQFIEQTWLATHEAGRAGARLRPICRCHHQDRIRPIRSQRSGDAQRDPQAAQRSDRERGHGRRLHQGQRALLSQQLGRAPSEGELYIAHFLGAGGAAQLISLRPTIRRPAPPSYFPNAAQANPSIFYDRTTGAPRSLAQVRDVLTARYDVAARTRPSEPSVAQAASAGARHRRVLSSRAVPPLPSAECCRAANVPAARPRLPPPCPTPPA